MKSILNRLRSPYKALEQSIGYSFRDRTLLEAALTHRSYRFENEGVEEDNQRMEFLGDAALGCVAGAHLYAHHAEVAEGGLTAARSAITSGKALARIAAGVQLGTFLRMGNGEERSGGRDRESNLADALEAVIGAAYLDGDLRAVERVFAKLFVPQIGGEVDPNDSVENPKGKLQELGQRHFKETPTYRVLREAGPAHDRTYVVGAFIGKRRVSDGAGRSKRHAESAAARQALRVIGDEIDDEPGQTE